MTVTRTVLTALLACCPIGAQALVAHTGKAAAGAFTTSAIDTTGANFIVAGTSGSVTICTPTDNKGNTFTPLTAEGAGNKTQLFYIQNPTVGAGHTFTCSGTANTAMEVAAFSGMATSSVLDAQSAGNTIGSSVTIQPGSITPSGSRLFVTSLQEAAVATSITIGSSFTITDAIFGVSGVNFGGALAFKVSAAAENPTWTIAPNGGVAASMATFKPATVKHHVVQ